jgi:hypothetical protein
MRWLGAWRQAVVRRGLANARGGHAPGSYRAGFDLAKRSKKSELDPLDAEKSAGYKYDLPPNRWPNKKL